MTFKTFLTNSIKGEKTTELAESGNISKSAQKQAKILDKGTVKEVKNLITKELGLVNSKRVMAYLQNNPILDDDEVFDEIAEFVEKHCYSS